jgi:hypothetical protein
VDGVAVVSQALALLRQRGRVTVGKLTQALGYASCHWLAER